MKNLHIQHPEDLIFDGKVACQNVIEVLQSAFNDINQEDNVVTVKYDGSPSIVFGTDVNNKRFFVGTKSVFNKGIKKICYTNDCIDYYYPDQEDLNKILRLCLKYLPRVAGIYQADFIGEGDKETTEFTPNTITYKFETAPRENIIMAAHACYVGDSFDDMIACPQSSLTLPGLDVKWVDTRVYVNEEQIFEEAFKYSMRAIVDQLEIMNDEDYPVFKTKVAKSRVLKLINSYIKNGSVMNNEVLANETAINYRVFELYFFIAQAKEILLNRFTQMEKVECFVNNRPVNHEGIVVIHIPTCTRLKLVKRYEFSRANFNNKKHAMAV